MAPKRNASLDELDSFEPHPLLPSSSKTRSGPSLRNSTHPKSSTSKATDQLLSAFPSPSKEQDEPSSGIEQDEQEQVRFAAEAMGNAVERYRKSQISAMDAFRTIHDSTSNAAVAAEYIAEI